MTPGQRALRALNDAAYAAHKLLRAEADPRADDVKPLLRMTDDLVDADLRAPAMRPVVLDGFGVRAAE